MARSRRKNPGCGTTTAASDKPFKQQEHRRERAALRRVNIVTNDPLSTRQFGNPWRGEKDGKQWFDAERHPEIMRK